MATEYCRHIRSNGTRCRSLALIGQVRCYWHTGLQQHHRGLTPPATLIPPQHADPAFLAANPIIAQYYAPRPIEFDFPAIEDRSSIQLALSMVLGALGRNRIDPRRAGSMIFALQVASSNVRDLPSDHSNTVRSSSIDPSGQPLAPDEDPDEIVETQLLIEEYEADLKMQEEDEDYESVFDEYEPPEKGPGYRRF